MGSGLAGMQEGELRIAEGRAAVTLQFQTESDRLFYQQNAERRNSIRAAVPRFFRTEPKPSSMCSATFPLEVELAYPYFRLAEKPNLSTDQAVYVLTNLLQTCRELQKKYQFMFSEQKVGFTQEGQILFWVNDDYFRNQPIEAIESQTSNRDRIFEAVLKRNSTPEFIGAVESIRKLPNPMGVEGRVGVQGLSRANELLAAKGALVLKHYRKTSLNDVVAKGYGWNSQLTSASSISYV